MADPSKRPARPLLHNFTLPDRLKWPHQRHLRCIKSNPIIATDPNTKSSSATEPTKHSDDDTPKTRHINELNIKPNYNGSVSHNDEIEAVHHKLMNDLRVAADKMKAPFFDGREKGMEESNTVAPPPPPWNLRSRRANESAAKQVVEEGENRERAKFSVTLTKEEIERDFLVMTGAKPPRRPKKRPKAVRKQFDMIFPGSWLKDITPERYKVDDFPEPGKE